jgi:hypothetical protein
MHFKQWLESRTYADQVRYVYHWDVESDWHKVLQKQGGRNSSGESMWKALWVSPNKDANESWATWIASGAEGNHPKTSFYLHTIAMPRDLYRKYYEKEANWDKQAVRELVIDSADWDQLRHVSVKYYSRSELLKLSFANDRRTEIHKKYPYGTNADLYRKRAKNLHIP